MISQTISHYRVLNKLGAGGMGEVYLAEDTKLRRKVALKLLPADLTRNEDRLRRFEQEAQAASALNHPNIITIYEIGLEGDTRFIATEFIEGETLRHRLQRTSLTLGETLDVAIQVASALVAAHQAGIVHRDIKPENIMLRGDGYIKVLDFGLAKLIEQKPLLADTEASTVVNVDTDPGVVMGTPHYMSPEQAQGIKVDGRTDVFSSGVVIYEMIAGRPPFEGATISDVIVAILAREPLPLVRHSPGVPIELQRIVSKALRKDREERYQTIKDMLIDLKNFKDELNIQAKLARAASEDLTKTAMPTASEEHAIIKTASMPVAQTEIMEPVHTASRAEYLISQIKRHKTGALISAALLLIAMIGVGYGLYRIISRSKPAPPFQAMEITKLTNNGKIKDAAISPDGKYVAYIVDDAGDSLWVRQTATSSNVQVIPPGDFQYTELTFSPDGNYICYVGHYSLSYHLRHGLEIRPALYQLPVLGGTPRKLIQGVTIGLGPATFSPDGKRCAFIGGDSDKGLRLMIANVDGSGEKTLYNAAEHFGFPSWSPDGKIIAFSVLRRDANEYYNNVVSIQVENGAEATISSFRWKYIEQVAWLPDGTGLIIVARDKDEGPNQVWHLTYPDGNAQRITNDLNNYTSLSLTTDSNSLVTVQSETVSNLWLAAGQDFSQVRRVTSGRNSGYGGVCFTPEGRIVYATDESGNYDIWIIDADGNNRKQLTFDTANQSWPSVSTDGRYIVFISPEEGTANYYIWRMNTDGSDLKKLASREVSSDLACSPDGKWVVHSDFNGTLWKIPIDGGEAIQLTSGNGTAFCPSISPDGKLLACYYSYAGGQKAGIAIIPMEGGQPSRIYDVFPTPPIYYTGSYELHWTPDGRGFAYTDTIKGISNIWIQALDGSQPKQLTHFASDKIFSFDFSRDGKQLALAQGNVTNDVVLISNFK